MKSYVSPSNHRLLSDAYNLALPGRAFYGAPKPER